MTRRFLILGHVQGVSFRDKTRQEALRLGLRGFARNLSDGSVEVQAIGPDAAVNELRQWLARGPALARVAQVLDLPAEADSSAGDHFDPDRFKIF